mmetsp:Transcript_39072/g.112886  ORF Transcript_39072/g.112886 Transcript_39072/m.112886 type:complete len:289 (-) Transcript_39072:299-1165(-)
MVQGKLLVVLLLILLDVKDAREDGDLDVVRFDRYVDQLLDGRWSVGNDLDGDLLRHARRQVTGDLGRFADQLPGRVTDPHEVGPPLAARRDHVPHDVDVQVPDIEAHAVNPSEAEGAEAASAGDDLDEVVAVAEALHRTGQFPMLLRGRGAVLALRGVLEVAQEVLRGDRRAPAGGVRARLPHFLHARGPRNILLVRDARGADSAVRRALDLEVLRVDLHVGLAERGFRRPELALVVPLRPLLVGVRPLRRVRALRDDGHACASPQWPRGGVHRRPPRREAAGVAPLA